MNVGLALLTLFPGRAGGAETYVRGLLGAYAAGEGPELTSALVARQNSSSLQGFASPTVSLTRIGSYKPGSGSLTRLLAMEAARFKKRALARDLPPDLDLVHYPVTVPIPQIDGLPKVVSLLDLQHHDLPAMFSTAERRFRSWAYDRSAVDADQVITITQFSADRISEKLGIESSKVHAIHLGIDHSVFAPDGPAATIAGLPERYVYYPANSWPHKNHDRLLEAFAAIDDPELHLLLTGSAVGTQPLPAGSDRVHHLGHVTTELVAALYRGAEALIFPSLYEGFGLPPAEAMACGCPVAASNVGAVSEVCGDAALLFDPTDVDAIADAIVRVTSDAELRERLRADGLLQAARFTWEETARQHLAVYRQALERAS
jgi:glycosyltransferase involved in cell wall biosynthesis